MPGSHRQIYITEQHVYPKTDLNNKLKWLYRLTLKIPQKYNKSASYIRDNLISSHEYIMIIALTIQYHDTMPIHSVIIWFKFFNSYYGFIDL
jgi:hypothetical protein